MNVPAVPNSLQSEFDHEEIALVKDAASGLVGCIAIHSTMLGPSAGGLRLSTYDSVDAAAVDALRLSRAMTLKSAAAGLDLGGGKAVLVDDGHWGDAGVRKARLLAFGKRVERLDGRYVTAEDVGTTPQDMKTIAEVTAHVTGLPGRSGDPSEPTARTVFAALGDAVEFALERSLSAVTVGVLGVGHVGGRLVGMLRTAGAKVIVADIDEARAAQVARETGALAIPVEGFTTRRMDVFAPCALGGVLGPHEINHLRCCVVAGAANNPLTDPALATDLHQRGILYVPDFLANCGGIIHVGADVLGFDRAETDRRIDAAVRQTRSVLVDAVATGRAPAALAMELVERRLARVAADPAGVR